MSMSAPTARYFRAFKSFIIRDMPLRERDQSFLENEDDLVALGEEQERGWLDGVIESRMDWSSPKKVLACKFLL